jgi:hypothetical protein
MKYSGQWTAGLSADEKKLFEELLETQHKVLDRLIEMCYNMLNESEKSNSDYDSPNWALRTADAVGYRRALEKVISLASPAKQRDNA